MFLGLILFLVLAVAAIVVVMKAVRSLLRRLLGKRDAKEVKKDPAERPEKPEKAPEKAVDQQESKVKEEVLSPEEEAIRERHAEAIDRGITEQVWTEVSSFEIDTRSLSDLFTAGGALSSLEFENRDLAGDDFHGFNIIMEEGSRLVLTCCGQAVASVSKVETAATAVINGVEVTGTGTAYRTNTFPPALSPGITPSDLSRMLSARERIKSCGGDPARVSEAMAREFLEGENVSRLKRSIDGKIQARVSTPKHTRENKMQTGPKRLS